MGRGASKASNGSGGGSSGIKGKVSFQDIIQASDNTINLTAGATISTPIRKGQTAIESGRKKDLGKLVDKYKINEAVVETYSSKSKGDLKRLEDLGFKIVAYQKDSSGSKTDKTRYYVKRRK